MDRVETWWTARLDRDLTCCRALDRGHRFCLLRSGHAGPCLSDAAFLDGLEAEWSQQARTLIVEAYGEAWDDPGLGPGP